MSLLLNRFNFFAKISKTRAFVIEFTEKFRQIDGICWLIEIFVNLTEISSTMVQFTIAKNLCNIPWEKKLCKKALQHPMGKKALLKSIWRKKCVCKGNFNTIVYLVNHIEIDFANCNRTKRIHSYFKAPKCTLFAILILQFGIYLDFRGSFKSQKTNSFTSQKECLL